MVVHTFTSCGSKAHPCADIQVVPGKHIFFLHPDKHTDRDSPFIADLKKCGTYLSVQRKSAIEGDQQKLMFAGPISSLGISWISSALPVRVII